MNSDILYKIIVIGDPFVGKTSLLYKFATTKFKEDYMKTIGANITKKTVDLNGRRIQLLIWDLAGQREFWEMFSSYFDGANGAIIVFDITRKETLDHVKDWYGECLKHDIGHVPMILVGNKIDLNRTVSKGEGKGVADKMKVPYFETSAKHGESVSEIFFTTAKCVDEYMKRR